MSKDISFPNSNLYLCGSGLDKNGNKIIKVNFANSRAFSIQTTGNLKLTGNILRGLKSAKDMESVSKPDLAIIEREVVKYIRENGTDVQKKKLKTYPK